MKQSGSPASVAAGTAGGAPASTSAFLSTAPCLLRPPSQALYAIFREPGRCTSMRPFCFKPSCPSWVSTCVCASSRVSLQDAFPPVPVIGTSCIPPLDASLNLEWSFPACWTKRLWGFRSFQGLQILFFLRTSSSQPRVNCKSISWRHMIRIVSMMRLQIDFKLIQLESLELTLEGCGPHSHQNTPIIGLMSAIFVFTVSSK